MKSLLFFLLFIFFLILSNVSLAACVQGEFCNPLSTDDPREFVGLLIKAALGLSGTIALLLFVYAGFVYLTSQGERERIERAKNTMIWATLGLLVIFGSNIFLDYIFKIFP